MSPEELNKLLESHAAQLSEYFDCVQIVAARVEPSGSTRGFMKGSGNWYARRALCQEFIERDQANTLAHAVKPAVQE